MKSGSSKEPGCPCGSQRSYGDCCGRLHGGALAETAEDLMRSRYSAYVRKLDDYLLATWHPDTRPASLSHEPGLRWLGLKIRRQAQLAEDQAEVEFEARYRVGGDTAKKMRETSAFRLLDGRWLYVDGQLED